MSKIKTNIEIDLSTLSTGNIPKWSGGIWSGIYYPFYYQNENFGIFIPIHLGEYNSTVEPVLAPNYHGVKTLGTFEKWFGNAYTKGTITEKVELYAGGKKFTIVIDGNNIVFKNANDEPVIKIHQDGDMSFFVT